MIYEQLFSREGERIARAALIGAGAYGTGLLAQSQRIRRLSIGVVADRDIAAAQAAVRRAGVPDERAVICETREELLRALEGGKCAITADPMLAMDAPVDVVVECTGDPEAGARHAAAAISHGKHVAMANKETDSVIGPILKRRADVAGVVYSAVDGDQPGLLMGLVSWARTLGLEVVCGGKARDAEFVYDETARKVAAGRSQIPIRPEDAWAFDPIAPDQAGRTVLKRKEALSAARQIADHDLCEMAVMANATGLMPDSPTLHAPILRTSEMPEALCHAEEGGILSSRAAIETVTCLRRPDEAGLGGGVFVVVACLDKGARQVLRAKGALSNRRGTRHLVYRPYHLCGVETAITVLCQGLLGVATGALDLIPRVDLAARALADLRAGEMIQPARGGALVLEGLLLPAKAIDGDNPLPWNMALGNRLKANVPAGNVLTRPMAIPPADSALWTLRREQDQLFL